MLLLWWAVLIQTVGQGADVHEADVQGADGHRASGHRHAEGACVRTGHPGTDLPGVST